MSIKNDKNIDPITLEILHKCEVSNLHQFYVKWVMQNNHIVPIKKICRFHKNFNEKKIQNDTQNFNDLIIVSVFDFVKKRNTIQHQKELYLVDHIGLAKILKNYKKRKIIEKTSEIENILKKLSVPRNNKNKFIELLNKSIQNKEIYAKILTAPNNNYNTRKNENEKFEAKLKFYNKLKHPDNKKELIKLIITIIGAILIITILLPIIIFINYT
ncbi:MAG: hypothetical protein ACP6IY_11800 [Promethearchaeia archaeon]